VVDIIRARKEPDFEPSLVRRDIRIEHSFQDVTFLGDPAVFIIGSQCAVRETWMVSNHGQAVALCAQPGVTDMHFSTNFRGNTLIIEKMVTEQEAVDLYQKMQADGIPGSIRRC
jgi:hypothetical protein